MNAAHKKYLLDLTRQSVDSILLVEHLIESGEWDADKAATALVYLSRANTHVFQLVGCLCAAGAKAEAKKKG